MKIFEAVKSALLDGLEDLAKFDHPYRIYDVHHYLYRHADHFISFTSAKEALIELDVWHCIEVIQDHKDGPYVDLRNPCKMANMIVYIMGGALLQRIYGDRNRALPVEEMQLMAQQWFEENDLMDIWEAV